MIYSMHWAGKHMRLFASILIALPVMTFSVNREDHPSGSTETGLVVLGRDSVSILAVGDLMLAGSMAPVLRQYGPDYPFDSVRTIIRNSDIAMANLEAPFADCGEAHDKKYTFRMRPDAVSGIKNAGFDLCTLANNHILDYGREGLAQTLQVLNSAGLAYCGAGMNRNEAEDPCIVTSHGIRVGFLAYSLTYPEDFWATLSRCGTAFPRQSALEKNIREIKQMADVVVVSFHWGGERMEHPKPYQREYARRVIDLGADVVIGHHPHVIQGIEKYKNKLIFYSLGNFAFGSTNPCYREGVMIKIWVNGEGPCSAEILPIDVDNTQDRFQPRLIRGREKDEVIKTINSISDANPLLPSGKIICD